MLLHRNVHTEAPKQVGFRGCAKAVSHSWHPGTREVAAGWLDLWSWLTLAPTLTFAKFAFGGPQKKGYSLNTTRNKILKFDDKAKYCVFYTCPLSIVNNNLLFNSILFLFLNQILILFQVPMPDSVSNKTQFKV